MADAASRQEMLKYLQAMGMVTVNTPCHQAAGRKPTLFRVPMG